VSYKLKITKKTGGTEYLVLDVDAFLTIKIKGKRTIQGTEVEYEVSPGNYKKVGGLMVPHAINTSGGPTGGATITFEKVEANVELSDDRFAMPEVKKPEPAPVSTEGAAKGEKKAKPESEKK
jgi:hypothetical protein